MREGREKLSVVLPHENRFYFSSVFVLMFYVGSFQLSDLLNPALGSLFLKHALFLFLLLSVMLKVVIFTFVLIYLIPFTQTIGN